MLRVAEEMFIIDRDVRIWGTVNSLKPVRVAGFVDGGVLAPEVLVAEQAMVTGDIIATTVTVYGQVLGNIFADKLVLQAASNVEGEIYHQTLELCGGAHFEGKSRHHDKPKSLASSLSHYAHPVAI